MLQVAIHANVSPIFRRMLQVFYLNVAYVVNVCFNCFTLFQYVAAGAAPHAGHARYTHPSSATYLCHAGQLQQSDVHAMDCQCPNGRVHLVHDKLIRSSGSPKERSYGHRPNFGGNLDLFLKFIILAFLSRTSSKSGILYVDCGAR
jgi:hypothetical protein